MFMGTIIAWLFEVAFWTAVSWALGEALKKKAKKPYSAAPSKLEVPDNTEGTPYAVVFGTPKFLSSPVVTWWGHVKTDPIRRHYYENRWGNQKRVYYTVAHHYSAGMLFKLCHGPIDGVKQVRAGGKVAWPNAGDETELAADGVTSISINEPNLFGGEEAEGGVVGDIDFQYGNPDQAVNSYLASQLGSNISAGRGFVQAILKQVRIGTSPYPKPWSFLLKRTQILDDGSPQWYLAKADISGDLNPAHFLRECYTNNRWGLNNSPSLIDDTSFTAAADTLYDEEFGVSRLWSDANESIEDLINDILQTINGKIYEDPQTGLFVLKLARDDYTIASLESFDDSDIKSVEGLVQVGYGQIPDQVRVTITDVIGNTVTSIPDQDIAVADIQGGRTIVMDRELYAVTKPGLGARLAARERQQVTSMLAPMTIKGKRTMAHLRPFDVIKYAYTPHKTLQRVVRVVDVNLGTLQDGTVILHCMDDVFSTQAAIIGNPSDIIPGGTANAPVASPYRRLDEAPFWVLLRDSGISVALALGDDAGFLLACASKPSADALDFELLVRDSLTASFEASGRGFFCPTATLDADLAMNAADIQIDLNDIEELDQVDTGTYAQIGAEIVKVTAVDTTNSRVTIARGVLDTVPAAHSAGDRIWFAEVGSYMVGEEYTATDQPGTKVLPRTSKGQLDPDDAPIDNATAFDSRAVRPYPPGNFKINSVSYPDNFSGEPTITWAHRDRTQQITELVEHDEASIGPEAGVTYTLKIYDSGGTLRRTETGLTGTTYTYSQANEISDCGGIQTQLRFVLYSVRDGYDSWQQYDITLPRVFVINDSLGITDAATPVEG